MVLGTLGIGSIQLVYCYLTNLGFWFRSYFSFSILQVSREKQKGRIRSRCIPGPDISSRGWGWRKPIPMWLRSSSLCRDKGSRKDASTAWSYRITPRLGWGMLATMTQTIIDTLTPLTLIWKMNLLMKSSTRKSQKCELFLNRKRRNYTPEKRRKLEYKLKRRTFVPSLPQTAIEYHHVKCQF